MVSSQTVQAPALAKDGPRPVNLRTDLASLADLIEIAFASSMDSGGRAAVREMRTVSSMPGIGLLGNMSGFMQGLGLGYVWVADGKLVGNVSVYPSNNFGMDGKTWVIVNVATHPDYQRRGIAQQLMTLTMEMIAQRGAGTALLQVDSDNPVARRLYTRLGFVEERSWSTWRRTGAYSLPAPIDRQPRVHITHRRANEWRAEYELAEFTRPAAAGGLGWMRPLHPRYFRRSLWQQLGDLFSFHRTERLIIRSTDEQSLLASMWIETSLGSTTQLTLMVHPDYEGVYDELLINSAVRRFGTGALGIEHPSDRTVTSALLKRYHFNMRREVVHMRWESQ
ncbi:MAG: GNAT family N-acetyltransferase [Anaerolineae bacterium]